MSSRNAGVFVFRKGRKLVFKALKENKNGRSQLIDDDYGGSRDHEVIPSSPKMNQTGVLLKRDFCFPGGHGGVGTKKIKMNEATHWRPTNRLCMHHKKKELPFSSSFYLLLN